ncbi:hypothetical protein S245_063223, partial [Arachis hypogaea]
FLICAILVLDVMLKVSANSEGDALNFLKNRLTDPAGVLQSWDSTLVNPCTWFHDTCSNDNSVIRIREIRQKYDMVTYLLEYIYYPDQIALHFFCEEELPNNLVRLDMLFQKVVEFGIEIQTKDQNVSCVAADRVKGRELNWEKRYDTIIGTAEGLVYLHENSKTRIIQRDIKASNILLDAKLRAKIICEFFIEVQKCGSIPIKSWTAITACLSHETESISQDKKRSHAGFVFKRLLNTLANSDSVQILQANSLNVDNRYPKAIRLRQMNLGRLGSLDALKIGKVARSVALFQLH